MKRAVRIARCGSTSSIRVATWARTNPLNDADLAEFVKLQKTVTDSPKNWSVDAKTIDPATFDLSVKNSDGGERVVHRIP